MYKYKRLLLGLSVLGSLIPALLYSQVDTAWVRRYNGQLNGWDCACAVTVDNAGNVYVTGWSLGSGTSVDYATIKYNSQGVRQWTQRYNGPGNDDDLAHSIAVDNAGNVYVTGGSYGSGTNYDYATIKYNSDGIQEWAQRYNGPSNYNDEASSLAVDTQGNVYVIGGSYDSGTCTDYATIKYDSLGNVQWVQRYNGTANSYDYAYAIAVDNSGNVYVTGGSYDKSTSDDYVTIKYNSAGVKQWVQRYNGPENSGDWARAIAVDNAGNVYVTGYSYGSGTCTDYATIKYNSAGVEQWVQTYNGPGNDWDYAYSLAVDVSGNVYVTGWSEGSGTGYDYATIKYDSAGVEQWVQRYNGPGNSCDYASAIAVDNTGNVYVTGSSWGSGTDYDYATIKYVQGAGVEERLTLDAGRSTLEVYPNPAKTYFTIRFSETLKQVQGDRMVIKIFDVSGKEVKGQEFKGSKEHTVSLAGIKNGVYFVQVGNELVKEKLVVTK